ncbi:MAG: DUF2817 domain-containing protein [Solirubrobacterales bacterium]|nr:DUF2817 domain-containing protein [Solirubrobacterales bacterium]
MQRRGRRFDRSRLRQQRTQLAARRLSPRPRVGALASVVPDRSSDARTTDPRVRDRRPTRGSRDARRWLHSRRRASRDRNRARARPSTTPIPGVALRVIPGLNPDGVAADTRQNGRGVDLNRNFPYRWDRANAPKNVLAA